jgi:hypothetical protein
MVFWGTLLQKLWKELGCVPSEALVKMTALEFHFGSAGLSEALLQQCQFPAQDLGFESVSFEDLSFEDLGLGLGKVDIQSLHLLTP